MSDLISRENAKDTFCERCDERIGFGLEVDDCREKLGCAMMRWLDKVKAVEAEPVRHGRWIYDGMVWHCSECGRNPTYGMGYTQGRNELYKYCPFCNARMDGKEKSDE